MKKVAALVGEAIKKSLAGDGSQLYKAAIHLPIQGGKRMRPFLVVKSCEAVGGEAKDALPAATAVELVHNFTLIHDDIMDRDLLRRGVPTVHTVWGVPMGILSGDLLFAEAFNVLLSGGVDCERLRRSAEILAKATVVLSEGQNMDMAFESRIDVSEAEYLDMIYRKTGALFQASAEMGGVMGGGDERSIRLLGEYGRNMGIGFQIFDDYLGMTSKEEVLGKSVGNDIREGKKTLIVIMALASLARGQLLKVLGKKTASDSEIAKLLESMGRHGVLEYVYGKAEAYISKATVAISKLPSSPARDALMDLAKYAISRKK
ncbi:MAG: polyprenyl synthetase family protein [Candidatus Verstraetearchaeota archaeon]|nr:polyprenyl synthetase family protein [Candidatus Verstraetearchaeota archaeon]